MSRRKFLKLSGLAAFAASWPAHAQKDLPVVAVLTPGDVRLSDDRIVAIRKGMQEAVSRRASIIHLRDLTVADEVVE
jgi:hypothetical protein